jgi:hypothetical protein
VPAHLTTLSRTFFSHSSKLYCRKRKESKDVRRVGNRRAKLRTINKSASAAHRELAGHPNSHPNSLARYKLHWTDHTRSYCRIVNISAYSSAQLPWLRSARPSSINPSQRPNAVTSQSPISVNHKLPYVEHWITAEMWPDWSFPRQYRHIYPQECQGPPIPAF